MLQRMPLLLCCALVTMACSERPDTLTFKPDDGEHRRYQMFTETYIEVTSSFGSDSDRIRTQMLMDYNVAEQSSVYDVLMQPQYIRMRFRNGGFSSLDAPNYRQEELWPLMEAGFTMVVDKQSGAAKDFIVHHNIDRMDKDGFDPIRELLQDEFSRPGYGSGIELREGATQQVPAKDLFPEVTLLVKALDNNMVTLSVSGENDEIKLYGYILLERDTGWLKRSTLIVDLPLQDDYAKGTARMVATVLPADWQFGQDLEFLRDSAYQLPIHTAKLPDSVDDYEAASEEKVFPTSSGSIDYYDDKLTLKYVHDVRDQESVGHIEVSNFQALDQSGDVIDLDLHGVSAFSYNFGSGEPLQTGVDVYPLGWSGIQGKLEQLASIEATMKRFPVTLDLVSVPVEATETIFEHQGARAILTPTDEERVYQLKLEYTDKAYFGMTVDGPTGGSVEYDQALGIPSWLDDGESRLLEVTRRGYFPTTYTLYFEEEIPGEIRLLTYLIGDEPMHEKQVRFFDPETVLSNIELEPLSNAYLFLGQDKYAIPTFGDYQFEVTTLQQIKPQDLNRPQLYMVLSHEQAAVCELQQTAEVKEAGRQLEWQERDPRQRYVLHELRLPNEVVYQLATEDGVRNFFYEHKVILSMHCEGEPEWHRLDMDLGQQSWLISTAELLGQHWEEEFADMPLADLLRRYRFLDAEGKALTLLPPPEFERQRGLDLSKLSVNDFVTEEGWLRVAGRVNEVHKLEASGASITREWKHQFPALPSSTAAYQN